MDVERAAHEALERYRAQQSFVGYGELRPDDVDTAFVHGFEAGATARAAEAVELITRHADTDGAHHKQWVLDRVLRALTDGTRHLEDGGTAP